MKKYDGVERREYQHEENFVMDSFRPNIYLQPKISGIKFIFSLRHGITEALIEDLSKTLTTNGNIFK